MGSPKSKLVISCCLVVSLWILPAVGQTAYESVPAENAPAGADALALPGQEFHCHTGYPPAQCQKDILQLKKVLTRYPIEGLGHWTWVLVRSQDWKPISRMLALNPDSPAFTSLDQRDTFLEEALFVHDPMRMAELMDEWQQPMSKLLELAVSHELGHAFCAEGSEFAADRFGEVLRKGLRPPCQASKTARKRVEAKERSLNPGGLSVSSVRADRMR